VSLFEEVPATLLAKQEYASPSICLVRFIVRFCDVTIPLLTPPSSDTSAALVMVAPLCVHVMDAAGFELSAVHVNTNGRPSTTATGFPDKTDVVGLTRNSIITKE